MRTASPADSDVGFAVRPALESVSPYIPGKPIAEVRRELGLRRVLKLASNENPLGPSPKALQAYRAAARDLHIYPEGSSPILRLELERRLGLPRGSVVVGNGSDEITRMLCEVLLDPGDEAVCPETAFIRFRQCAGLMGARVVRTRENGFAPDIEALAAAIGPRTKLLFVASPNNPTGVYLPAAGLERLLAAVPSRVVVILDEAYHEYARSKADYPDTLPKWVSRHPNLVVLRTFSKAYGLAGLRVGFGAAHPKLASWIDRIRMPFNVCLPAQSAALAALGDAAFVKRSVALVERERPKLSKGLEALGFKVRPSAANFVMAESPSPARQVFERLLREGVIVRPLNEYGLDRHLRITVGASSQNALLLKALAKAAR